MASEPEATDSSPLHSPDAVRSSELLFEQAKYLLDDEIAYAGSLRSQRSTTAGLLVVIVGIGLFRLDLFVRADDILPVAGWPMFVMNSLFTLAAICIILGTYNLYSERPLAVGKSNNSHSDDDGDDDGESATVYRDMATGKSTAALAILNLHRRHRKLLQDSPPLLVIRAKTLAMKLAYKRLAKANRRVRYRIETGRWWLFVGLVLVFLAFLVYVWTITSRWDSIRGGNDGEATTEIRAENG